MIRKTGGPFSAIAYLILFAGVGWSTTVPAKDQAALPDDSAPKILISKDQKNNSSTKEVAQDPNVTEVPDPATPFLVGAGLILLSFLRRGGRSQPSE